MKSLALLVSLPLVTGAVACVESDAKGSEEDAPSADGKDDSLIRPTNHGEIGFDAPVIAELTANEGHHAWTFEVTGDVEVDIFTGPATRNRYELDTVIYLYQQRMDGSWGRYIARNDDAGTSLWSSLDRRLEAGNYRVIVKGYTRSIRGRFALTVQCTGDGCRPPVANACTLGDTYGDIAAQPHLQILNRNKVTAATTWLSAQDKARIVKAVQQSSHTDVTTVEEAFQRVDQGEFNFTWILEPAAQRTYAAIEYGAGDNSYGAVFGRGLDLVAAIQDGDLTGCTLAPATCLLSDTFYEMRTDAAFTAGAVKRATGNTALSSLEASQVIAAVESVYGEAVSSLAEAFTRPDGGEVNLQPYTHRATMTALTAVEFGAGDTSVGVIFFAGTTTVAGTISDSSIEHCAFVAP